VPQKKYSLWYFSRKIFGESPPRVEYELTPFGTKFVRILDDLETLQKKETHLLVLSAVFMLMTFLVFVAYGCLAHAFRRLVIESAKAQTLLRYSFAAAFAGLGAKLATTDK
jgi:threonine/homoserine/homoserine lactone efflux protein